MAPSEAGQRAPSPAPFAAATARCVGWASAGNAAWKAELTGLVSSEMTGDFGGKPATVYKAVFICSLTQKLIARSLKDLLALKVGLETQAPQTRPN